MKISFKKISSGILIAAVFLLVSGACPSDKNTAGAKKEIIFGFASSLFPESTSRDFKISFQLWLREVFDRSSLNYFEPRLEVFDVGKLSSAYIRENNLYMLVLNSVEFLEKENSIKVEPVITTNVTVNSSFVVVSSGRFKSIDDLKGGSLTLTTHGGGVIADFWIKYLLAKRGVADINSYFKTISDAGHESEALLSVFFGKSDACVIRKEVFETTCELNPQIRKKTNVLETSPGLLQSVFCFTDKFNERERKDFMEAAFKMDDTQAGRQILTFFGQARLLKVTDENMYSIRRLYSEYSGMLTALSRNKNKYR